MASIAFRSATRFCTSVDGALTLAAEVDAWIDERTREESAALVPRYAHEIGSELRILESRHAARVTRDPQRRARRGPGAP